MNVIKNDSDRISCKSWGTHQDKDVLLFRLENDKGAYVELTNYGATIVSVNVPDKHGKLDSVVLGFSSLEGYLSDTCYIGSTVGRFANRIGGAQFIVDGKVYLLEKNDNDHTNHGGINGFNSLVFDYRIHDGKLSFMLFSMDGAGGYPGNLNVKVEYSWNDNHELTIQYTAISDAKTVVNFTNHAYFNLSPGNGNIVEHELTIHANEMLDTTKDYIPTGLIIPVPGILFYRNKIKNMMTGMGENLSGLNTYCILEKKDSRDAGVACILKEQNSGRVLRVSTTYPGVQVYTGDYLNSVRKSNRSDFYKPFDGVCLECQYYPDSPNHAHFPSTVIGPGQVFQEEIVFKFSVEV